MHLSRVYIHVLERDSVNRTAKIHVDQDEDPNCSTLMYCGWFKIIWLIFKKTNQRKYENASGYLTD